MPAVKPSRLPGPERRQQIIDAAREAFLTSGLSGARVRQIADVAGINEALLYHYFGSKEELFEVAVVEPLRDMIQALVATEQAMAQEDPADRVEVLYSGMSRLFSTMSEILPLLGMMLFSEQAPGKRFYEESFYPVLAQTMAAGEGAADGWLATPVDPIIAPAVFGMCFGVAMDHWFRGIDADPEVVARKLTHMMIYGLPKQTPPVKGQKTPAKPRVPRKSPKR